MLLTNSHKEKQLDELKDALGKLYPFTKVISNGKVFIIPRNSVITTNPSKVGITSGVPRYLKPISLNHVSALKIKKQAANRFGPMIVPSKLPRINTSIHDDFDNPAVLNDSGNVQKKKRSGSVVDKLKRTEQAETKSVFEMTPEEFDQAMIPRSVELFLDRQNRGLPLSIPAGHKYGRNEFIHVYNVNDIRLVALDESTGEVNLVRKISK